MTLNTEEQWMVRSHWPDGRVTEAVYSARLLAELETYLRQRYSGCQVEQLTHRSVTWSQWEDAT
jgi:hypothetical protein